MSKKNIGKIAQKIQKQMQKIVDESENLNKITIAFGKEKPITLAERRKT